MQLNWKIPAIALMVSSVGCSKEDNNMSEELVIEQREIGERDRVNKYELFNLIATVKQHKLKLIE